MDELAQKLNRASSQLDPGWDDLRVSESFASLGQRVRRRRLAGRGAVVVAMLLVAGAVALLLVPGHRSERDTAAVAESSEGGGASTDGRGSTGPASAPIVLEQPSPIRLSDGTTATPADASSEVVAVVVEPTSVVMRLDKGSVRFDVTRDPARTFTVEAGPVTVVVVGTSFTVSMLPEHVDVVVHHGRVRVEWDGGRQELWTGGRGLFPPLDDEEVGGEDGGRAGAGPTPDAGPSWQTLAERGDFDDAFPALEHAAVSGDIDDLLLAADVMRRTGRPGRAVSYLRRIVELHQDDPRTPVAAFTLGRVLLNELGSPREAAAAFAQAQILAPFGTLAEDALAREVEAWARAGDSTRAREKALRYQDLFPNGARSRSVKLHGGLD